MLMTEAIGWFAAVVLLSTIGRQVYTQWRGSSKGLSAMAFHRPDHRVHRIYRL
jgi:hypothetical protein